MHENLKETIKATLHNFDVVLIKMEQALVSYLSTQEGNFYEFKSIFPRVRTVHSDTEYLIIRRVIVRNGIILFCDLYNREFYVDDFSLDEIKTLIKSWAMDDGI